MIKLIKICFFVIISVKGYSQISIDSLINYFDSICLNCNSYEYNVLIEKKILEFDSTLKQKVIDFNENNKDNLRLIKDYNKLYKSLLSNRKLIISSNRKLFAGSIETTMSNILYLQFTTEIIAILDTVYCYEKDG